MSSSRSTFSVGAFAALWVAGCGSSSVGPDASTRDAAADNPDAGHGCVSLARCVAGCPDQACVDACKARATPEALALFQAQVACVFGSARATPPVTGACPNTDGGVCDPMRTNYQADECASCALAAQGPNGACNAQVTACQQSP